MSRARQSEGMTLVELMVAIGITAIVMAMTVPIFVNQHASYKRERNVKESQQSGQEAIELLRADLLQAGWSVLPQMAFYFQDGGSNGSDTIILNDTGLINLFTNPNARSMVVNDDCPGGAKILNIPPGSTGTSLALSKTIDINGDGNQDFAVGSGKYVISDITTPANKVAAISSASGSSVGLSSAIGGAYVAPTIYYCVDDGTYANCGNDPANPQYELNRNDRSTGSGHQPITENIIDLQVAYKDDSDTKGSCSAASQAGCSGQPGCEWLNGRCMGAWYGGPNCSGAGDGAGGFCATLNTFDPRQISLIRLSLVTRSQERDAGRQSDPKYCRPALENHSAAPVGGDTCGYVYRVYTMLIQPRSTGLMYLNNN